MIPKFLQTLADKFRGAPETGNSEFVDPVCGMKVDRSSRLAYQYEGVEYRFCSESCLGRFRQDPEKYLGKSQTRAAL